MLTLAGPAGVCPAITSDLFLGVRLRLAAVTFGERKREEVLQSLNDPDV